MPPDLGTRSKAMGIFRAILAALAAFSLLASCGGQTPQMALTSLAQGDPTKPYLGMSRQELITCAGQPYSIYSSGGSETLTYHYTGAGPVPGEAKPEKKDDKEKKGGLMGGMKKKDDKNWTCSASFVFQDDRVVKITFAHRDVNSPYAYQAGSSEKERAKNAEKGPQDVPTCNFSLPRCPRG
jgi:major membrane immunogen (membrane-anchored lipoprotein)